MKKLTHKDLEKVRAKLQKASVPKISIDGKPAFMYYDMSLGRIIWSQSKKTKINQDKSRVGKNISRPT